MKKLLLILGMMIILVAGGCQNDDVATYDIALILSDASNPFFKTIELHGKSTAKRKDLEMKVFDARNTLELELEAYEKAIESGAKIIILNPVDAEKSSEVARRAEEAGIHLILIDRIIDDDYYEAFIRSDNLLGGKLAAELATDLMDDGRILLMEGIQETSANLLRVQGFTDYLPPTLTIDHRLIADFSRQKAYEVIKENQELLKSVDLIFCANDEMALGIVDYMKEVDEYLPIIGFDGTNEALRAVKYGYLAGTIAQQGDIIAEQALDVAESLLKGEAIQRDYLIQLDIKTSIYRE